MSNFTVDRSCHAGGAKTIIDIDNGQSGRAAVEHAEQGGVTACSRAVSNACWHANDRCGCETSYN